MRRCAECAMRRLKALPKAGASVPSRTATWTFLVESSMKLGPG